LLQAEDFLRDVIPVEHSRASIHVRFSTVNSCA
jgi:hypothetical protein